MRVKILAKTPTKYPSLFTRVTISKNNKCNTCRRFGIKYDEIIGKSLIQTFSYIIIRDYNNII